MLHRVYCSCFQFLHFVVLFAIEKFSPCAFVNIVEVPHALTKHWFGSREFITLSASVFTVSLPIYPHFALLRISHRMCSVVYSITLPPCLLNRLFVMQYYSSISSIIFLPHIGQKFGVCTPSESYPYPYLTLSPTNLQ